MPREEISNVVNSTIRLFQGIPEKIEPKVHESESLDYSSQIKVGDVRIGIMQHENLVTVSVPIGDYEHHLVKRVEILQSKLVANGYELEKTKGTVNVYSKIVKN